VKTRFFAGHFLMIIIPTILTIAIPCWYGLARAASSPRILILPFTIYAEKDLSFLQKGIDAMLATRMMYGGKTDVVNTAAAQPILKNIPAIINKEKALALASELKTRYVLFGSVTVFGESISIAAGFYDADEDKMLVGFNKLGQNQGDVISHVALLSDLIHEKIFGNPPEKYEIKKSEESDPAAEKKAADQRKHPNNLIKNIHGASPAKLPEGLVQSYVAVPTGMNNTSWKSRKFKGVINRIAIGDVTGDNKNELVFIDGTAVNIFSLNNSQLTKVGSMRVGGKPINVDIADINHNGISEIFVTAFTSNSHRVNSFVLEWNGTRFNKILDKARYFFRVTEHPDLGKVLLGQKQNRKKEKSVFAKNAYMMTWRNGVYSPGDQYDLPGKMNIYESTHGDIADNRREMLLAYTSGDNISIRDKTGREIWVSEETYGGTNNFITLPAGRDAVKDKEHIYLPLRIYLADVDNDGQKEVLTIKNKSLVPRILEGIKFYKNGHIQCLAWNNSSLQPKWQTQKAAGYISDFIIADMDNDGISELVYAVVSKTSFSFAGSGKSYIVTQKIQ